MGELRFDARRMTEVLNRLDEIEEQLTSSINTTSEKLASIASNITGETVVSTLKSYNEKTLEVSKETINLMGKLKEFLAGQLEKYTSTETEAIDTLSDVQSILSQLEGGV